MGKRLYNQVVSAVEALEAVPQKVNLKDAVPLIRLGAPADFFGEYGVERWPKNRMNKAFLKMTFGLAADLIERLSSGEIDGAIATQKTAKPDITYQRIFTEASG